MPPLRENRKNRKKNREKLFSLDINVEFYSKSSVFNQKFY